MKCLIVADDIALPEIAQPRGIAGVLFVEKIAGHFAEKGKPLAKVAAAARKASESIVSLGIALRSCTLPGIGREDRIPHGKAELGLGIHGEPGVELVDYASAKEAAHTLADRLFAAVKPSRSYALLINNLGSTTPLEMGLIANEVLKHPKASKIKLVSGPATAVTSLDMHGFSLSLMPLTPEFEIALKSPASPLFWPGVHTHAKPKLIKLAKGIKPRSFAASKNAELHGILEKAAAILIRSESKLNALDAKVGDGDTGSTIANAARNLKKNLSSMPLAKLDLFFAALSDEMARAMGGSSGVLSAIFFSAASQAVGDGKHWKSALNAGLEKMMAYGGAKPGDRTMIDAIVPALAALNAGSLDDAAAAARKGANATAGMTKARAGRSSYVSAANLTGINDPGAEAIATLLEGLAAP